MEAKLERIDSSKVAIEIEVEGEEVAKAFEQAYRKLAQKANIPGFRKGKAPRHILEMRLGKEVFQDEALEILMPKAYGDAIEKHGIEPVERPEIKIEQFEEGKPLIFKATVTVKPEVKLGQYKGLGIAKPPVEVSAEEVEQRLKDLQEHHAKLVAVEDGTAEKGNFVLIDFEGLIDGVPFAGGMAKDYLLELGSGAFIPGFEDQLIGAKTGESRDVKVVFPEDYPAKELAGREAVFKTVVKEIKRKELSPLDDDFAKEVSEFATLEELKNNIENRLKQVAEVQSAREFRNKVVDTVVRQAEVEIPQVMVNRQLEHNLNNFQKRLEQQKLTLDQYLQYTHTERETFMEEMKREAEKRVKTDLVLEAIAKAEGIEATEEDVEKHVSDMAAVYREDLEKVRDFFHQPDNLFALKENIVMEKTIDYLCEQNNAAQA